MTAIVILGAAVWADGPSPTLRRRTQHGAALFQAGRGTCILPCGGLGQHPPSEAVVMRDLLISNGIPADMIHCETNSTTTYENLRNAQVILKALGISDICIVTDRYHGPRAIMTAWALGLRATHDAPANIGVPIGLRLKHICREALALTVYALRLRAWIARDRRDQNWLRNII